MPAPTLISPMAKMNVSKPPATRTNPEAFRVNSCDRSAVLPPGPVGPRPPVPSDVLTIPPLLCLSLLRCRRRARQQAPGVLHHQLLDLLVGQAEVASQRGRHASQEVVVAVPAVRMEVRLHEHVVPEKEPIAVARPYEPREVTHPLSVARMA